MSDKKQQITYISRENGQKVTADEAREDLDRSALWFREGEEPSETGWLPADNASNHIAGPVNKEPVNGGEPPLMSVGAGIFPPDEIMDQEEAQRRLAEDMAAKSDEKSGDDADQGEKKLTAKKRTSKK